MNLFSSAPARPRGIATIATMMALGLTLMSGCSSDKILQVETPDIVQPGDVNSAAGAHGVRVGALARFNSATSGAESLLLLGGLFADEWNNGDSFIARQEIDQRVVTVQNNFLDAANRVLHRTRIAAGQAIELLAEFDPNAPRAQVAEMHFLKAYTVNLLAEHYCDGLALSELVDGVEQYGTPMTTVAAFERALAHADEGIALITGTTAADLRVLNALRVTRGRILANLNRHPEAATAVAAVPTNYQYVVFHTQTPGLTNAFWAFNNDARRYSVSNNEGINGLNFATAGDPRLPVCLGGSTPCRNIGVTRSDRDDLTQPFYVQMLWPTRDAPVAIIIGAHARLIEAEAQLRAGNTAGSLLTLNTLRTTVTGLTPLVDAGTTAGRENQLFRERAFWLFGRGTRTGDLRRLIRQYGRAANTVFPTGAWHKGGNYGNDVNFPVPFSEANNPNVTATQTCLNRNA